MTKKTSIVQHGLVGGPVTTLTFPLSEAEAAEAAAAWRRSGIDGTLERAETAARAVLRARGLPEHGGHVVVEGDGTVRPFDKELDKPTPGCRYALVTGAVPKHSAEWYAATIVQEAARARTAMGDGRAQDAAWHGYRVGYAHAMLEFKTKMEGHADRGIRVRDGGRKGKAAAHHGPGAAKYPIYRAEFAALLRQHVGVGEARAQVARRHGVSVKTLQRAGCKK